MFTRRNLANQAQESIQGATSGASKEANKGENTHIVRMVLMVVNLFQRSLKIMMHLSVLVLRQERMLFLTSWMRLATMYVHMPDIFHAPH